MKSIEYFHNKLILGDCLDVMPHIPDESIDMILADLPYGKTGCKWDIVIPFESLWIQYKRIIKRLGAILLFGTEPFTSLLVCSNLEMFRYKWSWNKLRGGNWQLASKQPLNIIEDICAFSYAKAANGAKEVMNYYPIKTKRYKEVTAGGTPGTKYLNPNSMTALKKTYSDKFPISLLEFEKPTGKDRIHPTQKPVALFEYLIKTYTNEDNIVLDNVIGSGTTAIACLNTNRKFIGIEKEEKYYDIAKERINKVYTGR